jgi:hypothetical protein
LQNAALTNIGDAGGLLPSSTAGSLYVSLHSADPGEAGAQNTSEVSYTGYARVAVARSSSGWDVSGAVASNHAAITFGADTSGTVTATYIGVGTDSSGAGHLLYSGAITSPAGGLAIAPGITPAFAAAQLTLTAD